MVVAESKYLPGGAATQTAPINSSNPTTWKQIVGPIEPFLRATASRLTEQVQAFDPEVVPFAQYALTNQGKQLRPVLVALSGGAVGKLNDNLINVAVIIEMIHLATLVHDDIMDSASIRRRRPTLAANWGNEISVLLGDCLFAHALKLASSFPTTEVCRAVSSATNTVCSGEILQTLHRGEDGMDRAQYFKMIEMKTGELFALSCELGSGQAGANPFQRQLLREYGLALGTAYQVYDDCVDLVGLETRVGKSLGTDLASGKLTLPILIVLDRSSDVDATELLGVIKGWNGSQIRRVLELMEKYDALAESKRVINEILARAVGLLSDLPDTSGRQPLAELTHFLAQQTEALGCSN